MKAHSVEDTQIYVSRACVIEQERLSAFVVDEMMRFPKGAQQLIIGATQDFMSVHCKSENVAMIAGYTFCCVSSPYIQ